MPQPHRQLTVSRGVALSLQVASVLVGLGMLGLLLWEPHLEGRNAHATLFEIYFQDPFLAYVYVGSTPFFLALYRAFKLFGHARQQGAFSPLTVEGLQAIRRYALVLLGFVAGAAAFILVFGGEDRPAGLFMCLLAALGAGGIAVVAATFARKVQQALRRAEGAPAGAAGDRRPGADPADEATPRGQGARPGNPRVPDDRR